MSANNKPLVTIGIPTYNRAGTYLKGTLESAINQSYENIEIIISDNCSTDNTEELVKSFNSNRISYFKHDENIGANNNFNYCLEKASGEYFLLLHDDDLIDRDFVDTCMKSINYKTGVGLIRTGVRVINSEGKEYYSKSNSVNAKDVEFFLDQWINEGRTSVYMCSVLYHKDSLLKAGGFKTPKNLYQDVAAELILTAKLGRKDVYPVKASFRRHESNRGDDNIIYDWAVDSNYIVDLLSDLISNKKLIKEFKYKLARWNYHRAKRISSPLNRWYAYLVNYKIFDYEYSPIYYFYTKDIKPKFRKFL